MGADRLRLQRIRIGLMARVESGVRGRPCGPCASHCPTVTAPINPFDAMVDEVTRETYVAATIVHIVPRTRSRLIILHPRPASSRGHAEKVLHAFGMFEISRIHHGHWQCL